VTRTASITGIGESEYGRRVERPFSELQFDAIEKALGDAGVRPADVHAVFTDGQIMPGLLPIDEVQSTCGFSNLREVGYMSIGGAGIAYAVANAARLITDGHIDSALVYFGVDWGTRPGGPYGFHLKYPAKSALELPYGFYGQPVYFAALARTYMEKYGISPEDLSRGLGHIAVTQRRNALLSGQGQMKSPLSMEQYLESRFISDPLRLNDCCLISDGAGALVLTSDDSTSHAVRIQGWGHAEVDVTDEDYFSQNLEYPHFASAEKASKIAFEAAEVTWADIDVMEIYDCFTISVVLQLESMGFWEIGGGIEQLLLHEGLAVPKGSEKSIAFNTHGGFLSQSYLLGINHIIEAVKQLRHQAGVAQVPNAQKAVVSMAPAREHTTLVLSR